MATDLFDKVPVRNSWPMKDKFTFRVCQNKKHEQSNFSALTKTLTILENHFSTVIKVPGCFLDIF